MSLRGHSWPGGVLPPVYYIGNFLKEITPTGFFCNQSREKILYKCVLCRRIYSMGFQETIGQKIAVLAAFHRGRVLPRQFFWQGQQYIIEDISSTWQESAPGSDVRQYFFSIRVPGGHYYELKLDSRQMEWTLEAVYSPD